MRFPATNVRKWVMPSVVALFGATALVASTTANAIVITFDELSGADGTYIPQGYQGFSWLGGNDARSWVNNVASPLGIAAHSGANYAWSNGGANHVDMADGGLFNAVSVWVRTISAPSAFAIEGWSGANRLFSTTDYLGNVWTQVPLNFVMIDRLTFSNGTNLLIDDISVSLIPEPESWAMLLVGLALFAGCRTRT
jgi:hypothetical protein